MEIEIAGLAELRAQAAAMRDRTQNMGPGLLRAGLVPLKAAADRIDAGGPGWAPNTSGTPLLHDTGRLLASLSVSASGNVSYLDGNSIVVGTNVAYAAWLQDGTGIFGKRGERIVAKNGAALAFMLGGRKIVVRSIKGTPGRRFLFIDQQVIDRVVAILARYIMGQSPQET